MVTSREAQDWGLFLKGLLPFCATLGSEKCPFQDGMEVILSVDEDGMSRPTYKTKPLSLA